jgi:hypothetical protein
VKDPGFGLMRALCPVVVGEDSISAAERKRRFVFGSKAMVLALG